MARYVGRVATPLDHRRAFDYMADFTNVASWDETVSHAELLEGPAPGAVGSRFSVIVGVAGRDTALEYETTVSEAPSRLVLHAETGTIVSEDEVTVDPAEGGGSLVTYDADLSLKGPLRLLDPVLGLFFQRLGDKAASGLARELGGRLLD